MSDDELRRLVEQERERKRVLKRASNRAWNKTEKGRAYNAHNQRERKARKSLSHATRPRPLACELCYDTTRPIVFDHSHTSGEFRGWLCNNCNVALGLAKDDPDLLERMAAYVRHHKSPAE